VLCDMAIIEQFGVIKKSYTDRLFYLNLSTLKQRRLRVHMIEFFFKLRVVCMIQQYRLIFLSVKELTPEAIVINCIIIHFIIGYESILLCTYC